MTHWRNILGPVIEDRRFLLALDILVQARSASEFLHDFGALSTFAIAARRGVGKLPDPERTPCIDLELPPAADMISGIRTAERALRELPAEVQARIDAWDPERTARVISTIFSDGTDIAGRTQLGGRPPEWLALEDKTRIDAVWDAAGVRRAPVRIVPADRFEVAITEVSGPLGAVVSGDSREGFNGGGSYVRWIRVPADLDEAREFFSAHCDSVRVMPFLDGLPCSIHGMVFPSRTIGFRPVEMLVLRRPHSNRVHYAGAASFWTAPIGDTLHMRAMVERVGEFLRVHHDFRGAFTIDGVLTADGFLPTELNPRLGAALPRLFHGIDTHLPLFNRCLVEGYDLDWRPEELQAEVLRSTETSRSGNGISLVSKQVAEETQSVRFTEAGCIPCDESESEGSIRVGPGPTGSIVFFLPDPEKTPIGPSLAPRIAAMAAAADRLWDLGIGELQPAPSLR